MDPRAVLAMFKRTLAALFLLFIFFQSPALARDDGFFTTKRFALKTEVIRSMSVEDQVQKGLKDFSVIFARALDEFMAGDISAAEADLLRAREMWPEFFGTDFVLALLCEQKRDMATAARYYKSYLNKLGNLNDGRHGISAAVIKSLMPYGVETSDMAGILVGDRLAGYGIDLENVYPMIIVPSFAYQTAGLIAAMIVLSVVWVWLRTLIRRHYRMARVPEGFWICRNCEAENPYPNKICQECGKGTREKPKG